MNHAGRQTGELLRTPLGRSSQNAPSETVRKGPVVALRATETVLLGPFWPPDTAKIHVRSVARTPFRTVSERGFCEVRTGHRTWVAGIMLGVENAASARGESARVASYLLGNGRLGITET